MTILQRKVRERQAYNRDQLKQQQQNLEKQATVIQKNFRKILAQKQANKLRLQKERNILIMRLPTQERLDKYIGDEMKFHTFFKFGSKRKKQQKKSLPRLREDLRKVLN